MDLMLTVYRFVFLNLLILGCEGVQILPNYELSTYNSCEGNVVDLICKFQYAHYTTSPYLTVTWSDVTISSGHLRMGNILQNRPFTNTAGPQDVYNGVNITRLSAMERDGSIRLKIPGPMAEYKIFNCEVLAAGDSPVIYSRPVFAYNIVVGTVQELPSLPAEFQTIDTTVFAEVASLFSPIPSTSTELINPIPAAFPEQSTTPTVLLPSQIINTIPPINPLTSPQINLCLPKRRKINQTDVLEMQYKVLKEEKQKNKLEKKKL